MERTNGPGKVWGSKGEETERTAILNRATMLASWKGDIQQMPEGSAENCPNLSREGTPSKGDNSWEAITWCPCALETGVDHNKDNEGWGWPWLAPGASLKWN